MIALYIGAGDDLGIIKVLKDIKTFYFCDCQPFSEFGKEVHLREDGTNGFSRPNFIPNLKKNAKKENIILTRAETNKLIFNYNDQKIIYFINTSIPEDIDIIKEEIHDFDNLIVMGHDPHSIVLDYTSKQICFWGNQDTVYKPHDDDYEVQHLIYRLNREKKLLNRFNNFNLIKKKKILKFDNWNKFINSKQH